MLAATPFLLGLVPTVEFRDVGIQVLPGGWVLSIQFKPTSSMCNGWTASNHIHKALASLKAHFFVVREVNREALDGWVGMEQLKIE